jgi:hypothetical protein
MDAGFLLDSDLPEFLRGRVQVDGSRVFKRGYVPHEDDVVALTKRYVCDKAHGNCDINC